jgi:hypothetical protein
MWDNLYLFYINFVEREIDLVDNCNELKKHPKKAAAVMITYYFHWRRRNCLSVRTTWVIPHFLICFVLLNPLLPVDPSDSYFLFVDLVGFYTHLTYMQIFRRIFLSNYWWQESDIRSQASYMYPILWEAFLDSSYSYFLFSDLVGFYTRWTYLYAHFSSHFSKQLLMTGIWYLVTSFI